MIFQNDTPSSKDELRRRPFAERVADILVSDNADVSIVVGLHGPAGDGKTTLLNFIRDALGDEPNVVCIEFSPWQVDSTSEMPHEFLATLRDGLGDLKSSTSSGISDAMREYIGFFLTSDDSAQSSAGKRSLVQRNAVKGSLDVALLESGKRIVMLLDDVDRLDAPRLLELFKLLKITADFSSIAYVLAGDDAVIAATLSIAADRVEAGRELMEKTIQIPLSIPMADPQLLRDYFLRRLKTVLDPAAVAVRPDAEARFSEMFMQGLQFRVKTPRTAKQFINAISFALGMLKATVNTVDLIVVEGIRLLYPNLYAAMRDNRDDFLWYRISRDGPDADNRANELLQQASLGLKGAEQEAVQFLVRSLFPAFDRSRYPSRGDIDRWSDDKRVCSPEFFDRFFDYGGGESMT